MRYLLVLALFPLVACGPLTKTTSEKTRPATASRDSKDLVVAANGKPDTGAEKVAVPVSPSTEAPTSATADSGKESPSPKQSPMQSPTQSPAQTPVAAPALTLGAIRYSGSACPDSSVAANISPDRQAFTLLFDSFAVEAPENSRGQTQQGVCDVELDLVSTKGWQLTLLTVDERGYASLNDGDKVTLSTVFAFSAQGPKATLKSTLAGPLDDNFQRRASVNLLTAPWSGCEATKTLHVKVGVALKAASDLPAYLAVDSVDGELHHKTGLAFRRCQ